MLFRILYTLLFTLLLPFVLLRLLWRSIKAPDYRQRWGERFGVFVSPKWRRSAIWVHSVSVGETLAAVPLIEALQEQHPDTPLIITTTTPTGSAQVRRIFIKAIMTKKILHVYAPYDLPWILSRFINRARPKLLILMETELWPNILHACASRGIPVVLANGRLSEKSAQGYQKIACLVREMLNNIQTIAAQHENDGKRFVTLGFPESRLQVTGSIKFDLALSSDVIQQAGRLKAAWAGNGSGDERNESENRLVWLASSTHGGEDKILLNTFSRLKKIYPNLLLVLVPRHPERFMEVFDLCQANNFKTIRHSKTQHDEILAPSIDIVLGDTMGELLSFYGACDVAFVGGSLVPVGGHNLIEPAAWGKPMLTGRYLHNFSEISCLLTDNNALHICQNETEVFEHMNDLLASEKQRLLMGKQALQVSLQNRGALKKLLHLIDEAVSLWKAKYPV